MLEVDHIRVCSLAKILFERANSEVAYKELRDEFNNQRMGAPERAAAFLFLNRHCFNGLIRYNRDGFFNVGWGKYEALRRLQRQGAAGEVLSATNPLLASPYYDEDWEEDEDD